MRALRPGDRGLRSRTAALVLVGLVTASPLAAPGPARAALPAAVLSLGDSVPSGWACHCPPFPALYAGVLSRRLHVPVPLANLSGPGDVTADVRRQVDDPAVLPALRRASTVLIMVGANDVAPAFVADWRGRCAAAACYGPVVRRLTDELTATIARIRLLHRTPVDVVLLDYWNVVEDGRVAAASYGPRGVRAAATATSWTNAALRRVAGATRSRYVSTYVPFKGPRGTVDPTPLLAPDGDHPNALGHAVIARALLQAVPSG